LQSYAISKLSRIFTMSLDVADCARGLSPPEEYRYATKQTDCKAI